MIASLYCTGECLIRSCLFSNILAESLIYKVLLILTEYLIYKVLLILTESLIYKVLLILTESLICKNVLLDLVCFPFHPRLMQQQVDISRCGDCGTFLLYSICYILTYRVAGRDINYCLAC